MHEDEYWRTRIFREGEQRYIEAVLRPALEDLAKVRSRIREKMPATMSDDREIIAMYEAELKRLDAFEARLNNHMRTTSERVSRRLARPA